MWTACEGPLELIPVTSRRVGGPPSSDEYRGHRDRMSRPTLHVPLLRSHRTCRAQDESRFGSLPVHNRVGIKSNAKRAPLLCQRRGRVTAPVLRQPDHLSACAADAVPNTIQMIGAVPRDGLIGGNLQTKDIFCVELGHQTVMLGAIQEEDEPDEADSSDSESITSEHPIVGDCSNPNEGTLCMEPLSARSQDDDDDDDDDDNDDMVLASRVHQVMCQSDPTSQCLEETLALLKRKVASMLEAERTDAEAVACQCDSPHSDENGASASVLAIETFTSLLECDQSNSLDAQRKSLERQLQLSEMRRKELEKKNLELQRRLRSASSSCSTSAATSPALCLAGLQAPIEYPTSSGESSKLQSMRFTSDIEISHANPMWTEPGPLLSVGCARDICEEPVSLDSFRSRKPPVPPPQVAPPTVGRSPTVTPSLFDQEGKTSEQELSSQVEAIGEEITAIGIRISPYGKTWPECAGDSSLSASSARVACVTPSQSGKVKSPEADVAEAFAAQAPIRSHRGLGRGLVWFSGTEHNKDAPLAPRVGQRTTRLEQTGNAVGVCAVGKRFGIPPPHQTRHEDRRSTPSPQRARSPSNVGRSQRRPSSPTDATACMGERASRSAVERFQH